MNIYIFIYYDFVFVINVCKFCYDKLFFIFKIYVILWFLLKNIIIKIYSNNNFYILYVKEILYILVFFFVYFSEI